VSLFGQFASFEDERPLAESTFNAGNRHDSKPFPQLQVAAGVEVAE
jgi:hypothetical protein